MEEEIFKKSEINNDKLIKYGFIKEDNKFVYQKNIQENNFEIIITISNNNVKGKVIDKELDEEYLNYRIENQIGEFVNSIREEFINLLLDIRDKCCITKNFIYSQSNRISQIIKELYNDEPEFLWEDNSTGVYRNKNNKKWYGIIMNINRNKLEATDENIEVLNLKISPEKIKKLIKKKGYYNAYHMNKKYWITIVLDDEVTDNEIAELIKESYSYTVETKEWVIPTNPKYWDIINCFNNTNVIEWKQSKGMKKDDIIYIYVGSPYSCLLYKCQIIEDEIESTYTDIKQLMKIKLLEKYPQDKYKLNTLKEYGLTSVRSARRIPQKLIDKIKEDELNN